MERMLDDNEIEVPFQEKRVHHYRGRLEIEDVPLRELFVELLELLLEDADLLDALVDRSCVDRGIFRVQNWLLQEEVGRAVGWSTRSRPGERERSRSKPPLHS